MCAALCVCARMWGGWVKNNLLQAAHSSPIKQNRHHHHIIKLVCFRLERSKSCLALKHQTVFLFFLQVVTIDYVYITIMPIAPTAYVVVNVSLNSDLEYGLRLGPSSKHPLIRARWFKAPASVSPFSCCHAPWTELPCRCLLIMTLCPTMMVSGGPDTFHYCVCVWQANFYFSCRLPPAAALLPAPCSTALKVCLWYRCSLSGPTGFILF